MGNTTFKKPIFIYIYYAVLLLVLTSWRSQTQAPGMVLRLAFFSAVLVPILSAQKTWFAAIIALFVAVTEYGFSYSYMPTMYYFYAPVAILFAILVKPDKRKINPGLTIFLFYVLIVDLILCFKLENLSYCLIIVICFCCGLNNKNAKEITMNLGLAFSVSTLVLSLFFILMRDQFAVAYGDYGSTLERSGWTDPNYFGMILGMGVTTAIIEILRKNVNFWFKILYAGIAALAIPVLVLNASRGALLAVGAMAVIAIFSSKQKMYIKAGVVLLIIGFLLYLLNNDYFELLEYRMAQDDGSGSGRFDIWKHKLEVFLSDGNIFYWLFGYGNWGAYNLGYGHVQGFHNDYVALLVGYGLIGFTAFMYLLANPFMSIKNKRKYGTWTLVATVYLAFTGMTLEPLDQGRLPFWCFYFYVLALSQDAKNENLLAHASGNS